MCGAKGANFRFAQPHCKPKGLTKKAQVINWHSEADTFLQPSPNLAQKCNPRLTCARLTRAKQKD